MKIKFTSKELTDGLDRFALDLMEESNSEEALRDALSKLEGAACFIKWLLSEHCNLITALAETEISMTLEEFKKASGVYDYMKAKSGLNAKYGCLLSNIKEDLE